MAVTSKILLVDDDPVNRRLHRDILEAHGYAVIEADNGLLAMEMALTEQPHLILMDLLMPNPNGEETTRLLKHQASTAHIPIVAVTAMAMIDSKEAFFAAGGNGYLTKPFTPAQLLDEIERAFLLNRLTRTYSTSATEKSV